MMGEIRELKIQEQSLLARREKIRKSVDEDFAPKLEPIAKAMEEKSEVMRAWAELFLEAEAGGKKSLVMTHGTIGWRTGKHTLKTLTGWTFDRVLEKLKAIHQLSWIRTKEEVNKQKIIDDRESFSEAQLRTFGLKIVQEEPFFVEPNITEVEKRETVEAS